MRLIDADAFKQYCSEGLEEMRSLFKTDKGAELAVKVTESFLKDIDEQPTVNPKNVTEFADKCKECGKIQNEFFNFDAPMVKNSEAVNREAVIDLVADYDLNMGQVVKGIHALPSVTPQRPKAKWIIHPIDCHLACSKCLTRAPYDCKTNFCPVCGAEMGGADDDAFSY